MDDVMKTGMVSVFRNAKRTWWCKVPEGTRRLFVDEYCRRVYELDGQACVVVSYPEARGVWIYDLDSSSLSTAFLDELERAKGLRDAEFDDYEHETVLGNAQLYDQAGDIQRLLFPKA